MFVILPCYARTLVIIPVLYCIYHISQFPRIQTREVIVTAQARRVYANAHAYHINSISVNSDGETYISSDDLRINLWNLAVSDQSFSIFFVICLPKAGLVCCLQAHFSVTSVQI
jgi:hypothetical protein